MNRVRPSLILGLFLLLSGIVAGCGGPATDAAGHYFDEGNKLFQQGRYDEAIAEYTKAIELEPNYAEAY